jgi:hypothetical protein
VYLASAREHPPAVTVRQQQRDLGVLIGFMRDFNQRQSQIFLLVASFLVRYPSPDLQPLIDDDVAEAAAALAATYETAARGVIYEHRPASLPAEKLLAALKPMLAEASRGAGSTFDRDAAAALRRIGEGVRDAQTNETANRRAFLDLLGRVVKKEAPGSETPAEPEPPRLIVP